MTSAIVDHDGAAGVRSATGGNGQEVQELLAGRGRVVAVRGHTAADRHLGAGLDVDGLLGATEVGVGGLDAVVLDRDIAGSRGVAGASGVLALHTVAAVVPDVVLLDQNPLGAGDDVDPVTVLTGEMEVVGDHTAFNGDVLAADIDCGALTVAMDIALLQCDVAAPKHQSGGVLAGQV